VVIVVAIVVGGGEMEVVRGRGSGEKKRSGDGLDDRSTCGWMRAGRTWGGGL